MRVCGGDRARQSIAAPKGKHVRPTGAKVREALFAVLGKRVHDARVLDLFAGSGALGFEALSRGAASVVFVDNDASAVMSIRRNAVRLIPDADRWRIVPASALRALRMLRGTFDLIFVDPPYERGAADELKLLMHLGMLATDGMVVVEHRSGDRAGLPASLRLLKRAKYGDTTLSFARMRRESESAVDEASDAGPQPSTATRAARSRPAAPPGRERKRRRPSAR